MAHTGRGFGVALGRKGGSDPGGVRPQRGASQETLHARNIDPQVDTPTGPQKPAHGPHNTS